MYDPHLFDATVARWRFRCTLAWLALVSCSLALPAGAQVSTPPSSPHEASADGLPAGVQALLTRAGIPDTAMSAVVLATSGQRPAWLNWRAQAPMNPASTLKLVTTSAALDLLGPAYTWKTPVYTDGTLRDGVLQGNLYIKGQGDPMLVTERLWLLLRRVQGLGIRRIAGDIVLDHSAFDLPAVDPGAFDGEPLRPYNAAPDALLVNYRSQVLTFTPDAEQGVAWVSMEPPLDGVDLPATVALDGNEARTCGDWRGALQADFSNAQRPRFAGRYPLACGERVWPLAHPEPTRLAARAVGGVWRSLGGQLDGQVRDGVVPASARQRLAFESPPLSAAVHDTNKFSNNVMAQQLLLTMALAAPENTSGRATWAQAQEAVRRWWSERIGTTWPEPVLGNGSGLSRNSRISASSLGRLLQVAWQSGWMPELIASLPSSGEDGTLKRRDMEPGLAHLKTGSLKDVQALAGYVRGPNGQWRVLVVLVNHPKAYAARAAMEALVTWVATQP